MQQITHFFKRFNQALQPLWNRGMPPEVTISLDVAWPLLFIPIALVNQLLTPHLAWMVLFIVLSGVYLLALFWVRIRHRTLNYSARGRDPFLWLATR